MLLRIRSVHLRNTSFWDHPEGRCLTIQTYFSVVMTMRKTQKQNRKEDLRKGYRNLKRKYGRGGGGQGITTYFSNTLAVKFQLEKNAIHYYVF